MRTLQILQYFSDIEAKQEMKEHYEKMTFDEIISYLKKGKDVKIVTFPVTVNSPTIKFMVQSLQNYRDNYNKYKLLALKREQAQEKKNPVNNTFEVQVKSQWAQFYDHILLEVIEKGKTIEYKPEECNNMQKLVQFYSVNLDKINDCYSQLNNVDTSQASFWDKVEKCVTHAATQIGHQKLSTANEPIKVGNLIENKFEETKKQTQRVQSGKSDSNKKRRINRSPSPASHGNAKANERMLQGIKQLQELLVNPEFNYLEYKRKEQEVALSGVPANVLSVMQEEYKKWYNVYRSLANNLHSSITSINQIEGKTLAEKCQTLAKDINELIREKSAELHKEMEADMHNGSKHLMTLFRLYNTVIQRKDTQLHNIKTQLQEQKQKAKVKQPEPSVISHPKIQEPKSAGGFMSYIFGKNQNNSNQSQENLKIEIKNLEGQLRAMNQQLQTTKQVLQHKSIRMAQRQKQNQVLKMNLEIAKSQLVTMKVHYDKVNSQYKQVVTKLNPQQQSKPQKQSVGTQKQAGQDLEGVSECNNLLRKRIAKSEKNQIFFQNLALQIYSENEINLIDDETIDNFFNELFKQYKHSKDAQISQDFSPNDPIDKKRKAIFIMLKLRNRKLAEKQFSPTNSLQSQRERNMMMIKGAFDMKIESKEDRDRGLVRSNAFECIRRIDDQQRAISMKKKSQSRLKDLTEGNQRLKLSVKTLIKRLSKYESVDTLNESQIPKPNDRRQEESPDLRKNSQVQKMVLKFQRKLKEAKNKQSQLDEKILKSQQQISELQNQVAQLRTQNTTLQAELKRQKQQSRRNNSPQKPYKQEQNPQLPSSVKNNQETIKLQLQTINSKKMCDCNKRVLNNLKKLIQLEQKNQREQISQGAQLRQKDNKQSMAK